MPLLLAAVMLASMVVAVPTASGTLTMSWQIMEIDPHGGTDSAIAVDSLGHVHISYLDDYPNADLKYANNSGGGWVTQTIETIQATGWASSIAIDQQGWAHISYYNYSAYNLNYATNKGGSWKVETVDGTNDTGGSTSIALDSLGYAHISYWLSGLNKLGYATNAGGSWAIETIGDVGSDSSIAVDSQDHVHISYYSSGSLHYITNAGGSWNDQNLDGPYGVGITSAIALDANDKVHIAYQHHDGVSAPTYLAYVTNAGGSWDYQTVDNAHDPTGSYCDLALDALGHAHISYIGIGSQVVKYANNVAGSWDSMNVDDNGCYETSIALDQDGYAHISYRAYNTPALRYATNTPVSDAIAPTVSITGPTSSETYSTTSGTLTLSGSANDNVAVTSVTWQNSANSASGTATGTSTWSVSDLGLATGVNLITVTASDAASNQGTDTITVTYTPASDTTEPTISLTLTDDEYVTISPYAIITGSASDNTGVTQVTWYNSGTGASGVCTGTTSWEANVSFAVGANHVTFTAHDAAGNLATHTITWTYEAGDTTDPSISITSPPPGSTFSTNVSTVTVTGTSSDNVGVTSVTWQNSRGGTGNAETEGDEWSTGAIQLQDGDNVITVYAHDSAGNTAYSSITVHYSPIDEGDMTFRGWEYVAVGIVAVGIVLVLAFFMMKRKKKDDKKG
jgi:hypothetical protein